jgi:putative Mg2+ transporter-C (MgtC) family protein
MNLLDFSLRLGLALILGAAVGVERQWRQKSAGLRTNTLVSLGSAAFMLLSDSLTGGSGDHSRVAGQIVTGIGFLGAGVIMRNGMTVQGLNTAATIWCSAAVGSLAGSGLWGEAVLTAGAIIITHLLLRPLGNSLSRSSFVKVEDSPTDYLITIKCSQAVESDIRIMLMQTLTKDDNLLLRSLTSSEDGDPTTTIISAEITANGLQDNRMEKLASRLTLEREVKRVKWELIGQEHENDL